MPTAQFAIIRILSGPSVLKPLQIQTNFRVFCFVRVLLNYLQRSTQIGHLICSYDAMRLLVYCILFEFNDFE